MKAGRVQCRAWLTGGPKKNVLILLLVLLNLGFPGGLDGKNLPVMWKTQVQSLGQEDSLEEEMATHSSILAWRILWTEEPGGL